jgi:Zn finger protein HypA/HybF involved in hydrogenase expression
MHEVSLVAELVDECERRAAGAPVGLVRVRHASSIPESVIQQAFAMLTEGGLLASARLEVESFDVRLQCPCGFDGVLGHDEVLSSSMVVCPVCATVHSRPRTADLELLEVTAATPG